MTFEQQIFKTIRNAKAYSGLLLDQIGARQSYGEDLVTIKERFILLGKWIEILQFYLDNNFDANGNITPIEVCLTEKQIQDLIAKVKLIIGNNRFTFSTWLLAYGFFDVTGRWENDQQWNNYPPLN